MKMPWDKSRTGEIPDIPEFLRRGPDNLNPYMRARMRLAQYRNANREIAELWACKCLQPGLGGDCDGSCTHPNPVGSPPASSPTWLPPWGSTSLSRDA